MNHEASPDKGPITNTVKLEYDDLRDFLENASVPLHWMDEQGIILWANKAELDYVGYTEQEYVGKPLRNFHADPKVIDDILIRLRNNEIVSNYRARLVAKNGDIKEVLINSNVLKREGRFIHSRCFTRDFNEIAEEEKRRSKLFIELAESEARLRMAIESTRLGSWDYDITTGKLQWSDECLYIYGLPAGSQIDYETYNMLIHPEDREQVTLEIKKAMDNPSINGFDVTHRIVRPNNEEVRWVRGQGKVYFNLLNEPVRFIGTVLDITETRNADLKSARLAAIVATSNDAIISKSVDGIITTWNQAAENLFGYTESEIIGESIFKLIPADRHKEELDILAKLRMGERIRDYETKRVTKSGRLLDISLTIAPIRDVTGKIIGSSKIARDITHKKQEDQRKSDFIALVSHELKTPLTTLLTYSQLLLQSSEQQDTFTTTALRKMETQAKRMNAMISEFLDLSRLEDGKLQLSKEVFNIGKLIEEVVEEQRILASDRKIIFCNNAPFDVCADKNKIGHVIMNLVTNAVKYSAKGAIVNVTTEHLGNKIRISVTDVGVGIAASDQQKLFERFYRVENEKIKEVKGYGIGLYLVSEFLKLHGTNIDVKSQENVGSTFSFVLDIFKHSA